MSKTKSELCEKMVYVSTNKLTNRRIVYNKQNISLNSISCFTNLSHTHLNLDDLDAKSLKGGLKK
jgi:hypothetical protein